MPRTTLNLDAPIFRELKQLGKKEGKSLGRLVSDLLAEALRRAREDERPRSPFRWISQPLGPRVDLGDRDAIHALLDRDEARTASQP